MSRIIDDWLHCNHEALFDDALFIPSFGEFSGAFTDWKAAADRTQNKTIRLQRAEEAFTTIYRKLYTGFLKDSPYDGIFYR
ncbi:MAG: hypothetical protein LBD91_04580 [Prevotellaceae bacterium]|jgi:hypothetical protein|nr:hypothetical protein [Prevotellaceae bacterium]